MTRLTGTSDTHRGEIVFAFFVAACVYLIWLARDVIMLLYVAALFAVVLRPLVHATGRLCIGRWQPLKGRAILFLLLAVAGALTAFGFLAFPPVLHDLEQLVSQAPQRLPGLLEKFHRIPFFNRLNGAQLSAKLQGLGSQSAAYMLRSVTSWAGKLAGLISGFVLMLYFIVEGDSAYRWLLSFFPVQRRQRLDRTLQRASVRMEKWLVGQASLMLIFAIASTITFLCLGVRYPYALGVLTGLLNIIPVLGDVVSLALALTVAALDSWGRVLGVAIFFAVYLQIENSYLVPRIMKTRLDLPALSILVALLLGFALEGVLGALVAIPTAVLVAVLLEEYLVYEDTP